MRLIASTSKSVRVRTTVLLKRRRKHYTGTLPRNAFRVHNTLRNGTVLQPTMRSGILTRVNERIGVHGLLLAPPKHVRRPSPTRLIRPMVTSTLFVNGNGRMMAPILPNRLPQTSNPFLFLTTINFSMRRLRRFAIISNLIRNVSTMRRTLTINLKATLRVSLALRLTTLMIKTRLFRLISRPPTHNTKCRPTYLRNVRRRLRLHRVGNTTNGRVPTTPTPTRLSIVTRHARYLGVTMRTLTLTTSTLHLRRLRRLQRIRRIIFVNLLLGGTR